jgi:CBS domain-containing protein
MSIANFYKRQLDTARAEESVRDAAQRMHQRMVGSLVVVDEFNRPTAMLTDRDLAIRVVAAGRDPYTAQVQEVMSAPATCIDTECSLEHAIATMRSITVRRLPVVDHNGKLVGIITLDDIWQHLAQEMTKAGQLLEQQSPMAVAVF